MDKKRIEIIITSALVIIFILAWAKSIKILRQRSGGKNAPQRITSPRDATMPVASPESKTDIPTMKKLDEEKKDLIWSRDPFSGKIYSSREKGATLVLEGILWDPYNPHVVINNELFSRGDKVDDYDIVNIEKDRVILSDGVKNIELKIE